MTLKLVVDNDAERAKARSESTEGSAAANAVRSHEPMTPPASPGTLPLELAQRLNHGEPVVWWGEKSQINPRPAMVAAAGGVVLLLLATLFVPELWGQPWRDLVKPVLATQVPAIFLLVREWLGRRALVVTDTGVLDMSPSGAGDRLGFRGVRAVKRDWLTGGVRLVGVRHEVRVPPELMDETRAAIASQTVHMMDFGSEGPDDPQSWFPWPGR